MEQNRSSAPAFIEKRAPAAESATETGQGLRFVLGTDSPDLQGDVVIQSGLVPAYSPLPAMVDHGRGLAELVGTWKNLVNAGGRLSADLDLLPQGISPAADLVRAVHKAGIRLGASVKFLPDWTAAEHIREKNAPKGRIVGTRYGAGRLVEASVCVMPCNAEALQEVGKSLTANQRGALDQLIRMEATRHQATRAKAVAAVQRIDAFLSA